MQGPSKDFLCKLFFPAISLLTMTNVAPSRGVQLTVMSMAIYNVRCPADLAF